MTAVRLPPRVHEAARRVCSQNWSDQDLPCARSDPSAHERRGELLSGRSAAQEEPP